MTEVNLQENFKQDIVITLPIKENKITAINPYI